MWYVGGGGGGGGWEMRTGFTWGKLLGRENLEELREMLRGSVHVSYFRDVGTSKQLVQL